MSPESLTEVCLSRFRDFADQYNYLISVNRQAYAELLLKEGKLLAKTLDEDEPLLVLSDLREIVSRSDPNF